jgi:hypothetical protein
MSMHYHVSRPTSASPLYSTITLPIAATAIVLSSSTPTHVKCEQQTSSCKHINANVFQIHLIQLQDKGLDRLARRFT